jgi:hypothetical protein
MLGKPCSVGISHGTGCRVLLLLLLMRLRQPSRAIVVNGPTTTTCTGGKAGEHVAL